MAIDGRISVDALFHDTDGTASLKVVSLQSSKAYTSDKVAIVTGTIGSSLIAINPAAISYRNAAGDLVSISSVSRIAFMAGKRCKIEPASEDTLVWASPNEPVLFNTEQGNDLISISPAALGTATATYTLLLYGT